MTGQASADGPEGFLADLELEGLSPESRDGVMLYLVVPVTGPFAGQAISTGVSLDELQGWPAVPPHWIHLSKEVQFASTNIDQQGVLEGWQRHSRDIGQWDMSRRPILNWISHVRGVLGHAA